MSHETNIILDSANYGTTDAIKYINNFISTHKGNNLCIDISKYNFLEATNICIIASTYSYTKNPDKMLTWLVNSNNTQNSIERLKLNNIYIEVKKDKPIYTSLSA